MYRLGIDLGGTNIAVGLVDKDCRIVAQKSAPTQVERGGEAIVETMAELCRAVCETAGVSFEKVESVGVAAPGTVNHTTGVVEYANNLPFHRFPLAQLLGEIIPCGNIHVENDANAAAWGEAVAGAAKGTSDSVMVTLGTGVGGGIVIDGKVYSGFNCAGAELGHMVIVAGGRPCTCGRRGCWEAYSSATALIAMTKEKMEECRKTGRGTLLEDLAREKGKVSGRTAFDGMRKGDAAAREVVDEYCSYLACGITNLVNIFQPEVLSIGGGISNEGDDLVNRLMDTIRKERYGGDVVTPCRIRVAQLKNDAGIIGAAMLGTGKEEA